MTLCLERDTRSFSELESGPSGFWASPHICQRQANVGHQTRLAPKIAARTWVHATSLVTRVCPTEISEVITSDMAIFRQRIRMRTMHVVENSESLDAGAFLVPNPARSSRMRLLGNLAALRERCSGFGANCRGPRSGLLLVGRQSLPEASRLPELVR